jgi:hypothetical protein
MSKISLTPHIKGQIEEKHVGLRATVTNIWDYVARRWKKETVLSEAYSVGILDEKHPCKTGCWSYDSTDARHVIKISPLAYDTIATPSLGAGVRKLVAQLFTAVYEHEAAHSRFTTKNLKGLNDALKAKKIPWRLLNLFEDVRIENRWMRMLRRRFNWLRWEKYPDDVSKVTPSALLYWLKTSMTINGGIPRACRTHFHIHPNWSKVTAYYWDILRCNTTEELVDVAERWLKDFPRTSDDSIEGAGGMGGDLGTGDLKDAMTEAGEAVEKVKSGDRGPINPEHGKAPSTEIRPGTVTDKGTGPGDATGAESALYEGELPKTKEEQNEFKTAFRLAAMLATAFKGEGVMKAPSTRPSRRLNLKAILRKCYDLPYIGKVVGRAGRPHISILFDGSSSMRGAVCSIDREGKTIINSDVAGRILLRALSILARKGFISGDAYLCASGGVNFRTALPIRPLDFKRFHGFSGSEGFGQALTPTRAKAATSCFAEVSRHRLAICYTDGCITDKEINRGPLHERGVHTLGICCTMADRTTQLKEHFDTPISRASLWSLADALVRFLKTRAI